MARSDAWGAPPHATFGSARRAVNLRPHIEGHPQPRRTPHHRWIFARADGRTGRLTLRTNGLAKGEELAVTVCSKPGQLTAGKSVTFDIPRARN